MSERETQRRAEEEHRGDDPQGQETAVEEDTDEAEAQVDDNGPAQEDEQAADGGQEELERLRSKVDEHWNEVVRTRAEMENLRKRNARQMEQARKYALEGFVSDLLPVKDSLEKGLEAAEGDNEESAQLAAQLREGSELTLKMLEKVLADHGLTEIDPEGEKLDPERHEAMTTQPSAEHEPDTVLMVLQKGYMLNDRLIRPARVIVAREPDEGG